MTFTEIKTLLEAEGATGVGLGGSYKEFGTGTNIQQIYFFPASSDSDVEPEVLTFKVKVLGEDNYKYYGKKPDILRERPTVTPPRDFHFQMPAVISWLNGNGFNLLDEDEVTLSRAGNFDRVTAQVIITEIVDEGPPVVEKEYVTDIEFLVDKDDQGSAVVRQVK